MGDGPCPIGSGIQTLRLRKNGSVSLPSTSNDGDSPGTMQTVPFVLPTSGGGEQMLQLNILTAIGAPLGEGVAAQREWRSPRP